MDENEFIFPWYDRFETVNKGVKRIFLVILLPTAAYFTISGLVVFYHLFFDTGVGNPQSELLSWGIKLTFGGIGGYTAFWFLFRGLLWIIDGFKEN